MNEDSGNGFYHLTAVRIFLDGIADLIGARGIVNAGQFTKWRLPRLAQLSLRNSLTKQ